MYQNKFEQFKNDYQEKRKRTQQKEVGADKNKDKINKLV